jgi:hypothetical protein
MKKLEEGQTWLACDVNKAAYISFRADCLKRGVLVKNGISSLIVNYVNQVERDERELRRMEEREFIISENKETSPVV